MGNCLRRESSSMVWADDDDDDWKLHVAPKRPPIIVEKRSLLGDDNNNEAFVSSSSSSSSSSKEVKIRVTKKQLEELLRRVNKHEDMSAADQLLCRLINGSEDDDFENHHNQRYSWRPRLQSIPEKD